MDTTPHRPGTVAPPPALALAVRYLITRDGAPATAGRLGIGRGTAERIAGRLPVRRATVVMVAQLLEMEPR